MPKGYMYVKKMSATIILNMVSISSTFYVRIIICTNGVSAALSCYVLDLAKNLYEKCACLTLMKLTNGLCFKMISYINPLIYFVL